MQKSVIIIVTIFVIISVTLAIYLPIRKNYSEKIDNEIENNFDEFNYCNNDIDCSFYYSKYSEKYLCASCFYSDEAYICINKEEAIQKREEHWEKYGKGVACVTCQLGDKDKYYCKCINNKCFKKSE